MAATSRRLTRLALPLILLVATFFRFYALAGQSLWSDEGNSVALARRGFVEIAQRTAFDIHPPLYYWLLKLWIGLFGDSEIGLRSLSAGLGVVVVYLVWRLASHRFGRRVGLTAALIAALSPLQVYYAQEARMYMLLALLATLTVWLAVLIVEQPDRFWLKLAYVATVTAGLYTHYAYPVVWVAAVGGGAVGVSGQRSAVSGQQRGRRWPAVGGWMGLQLVPLALYLPWLPTAWRQVTTWPAEPQAAGITTSLQTVADTLLFGLSWPYETGRLSVVGLAILLALAAVALSQRTPSALPASSPHPRPPYPALLLVLWFLGPVVLTIVIFSPAFLKFLLVAAPPLAILAAVGLGQLARRGWLGATLSSAALAGIVAALLLSLYSYYTDAAFARDDYRGIVQFIKAVGGAEDAVILNAEGQQDVFGYYFEQEPAVALPVHPLPQRRPLDEAATVAQLDVIAAASDTVYAVYWATQQADPDGVIEGWLDDRLYKATDRWFGNVRLVSYAGTGGDQPYRAVDYRWENGIRLTGAALPSQVRPGEIMRVGLQWQTTSPPAEDYTAFVQVLDANNHLVGQRDAQPSTPTSTWPVDGSVADSHGIFIEPGTPPGSHRVVAGLYDSQSGQRLRLVDGAGSRDFVLLGEVEIVRSAGLLPVGAFDFQQPVGAAQQGLRLLGVDFYKLGHRSAPETSLRPGDAVQLVAYWSSATTDATVGDDVEITIIDERGQAVGVAQRRPLAGVDYPPAQWQAGEIVRAQYSFPLAVEPGSYRLRLTVAGRESGSPFEVTLPAFRVE